MNKTLCLTLAMVLTAGAWAADSKTSKSLGSNWLMRQQSKTDWSFGAGEKLPQPAATAMAVLAFTKSSNKYREGDGPFVKRAVQYILKYIQADGSICDPAFGLQNYQTAICMAALKSVENPQYAPVVQKAADFLKSSQRKDGGWAYNKEGDKDTSDLSNTGLALEALKEAGVAKDDEIWKRAVQFLDSVQNCAEVNKGDKAQNDGGYIYKTDASPAGEIQKDGKTVGYKSYGGITYVGYKSLLYAGLGPDDPRVKAVLNWIQNNYTVKENPGLGASGRFYYWHAMAKALAASGKTVLKTADGTEVNWAKDLMDAVIAQQQPDGSWVNTDTKWSEGSPILCTAFALQTLDICDAALKAASKPK